MFYGTDRRMHERFDINEQFMDSTWWVQKKGIIASLLNKHTACLVKDISLGGLSFITGEPPRLGEHVGVSIAYGNYAEFPLTGRVRSIGLLGEERINGEIQKIYRVSIQYLYCSDKSMNYLSRLIDRLKASHEVA